jgi:hypothetical protein
VPGCWQAFHPPFSFRSCRKENGPCTVQKKRTLSAELAHKAQVRLNAGAVLANCRQFSSLLPARAGLFPQTSVPRVCILGSRRWWSSESPSSWPRCRCPGAPSGAAAESEAAGIRNLQTPARTTPRIGVPRVHTPAVVAGGHRKACPPSPAAAAPALPGSGSGKSSRGYPEPPNPRPHHAANRRSPRVHPGSCRWWSSESLSSWPRCRCPGAPSGAAAESEAAGIRNLQTPARTTPRAETFLEPDKLSHRETFFLFHRARRIFFLMSQNGAPAGT